MKVVRINEPSQFDQVLKESLNEEHSHLFVLFFGTELAETNESWCPDCVIADPKVRSHVLKVKDSILLEVPVGDRASYKNKPEHPYRVHDQIKLKAIPTLIRWTKDGPQTTLVEAECYQDDRLESFFKL